MNKMPICPDCGKEQGRNIEAETRNIEKPSNNDLNVCAYCGNISMFLNDGKSLRKINDADKDFIKKNKAIFREVMNISSKIKTERALEALKVFNKAYKRNNY